MKNSADCYAYEVLRAFALTHNYNKWIFDIFQPYIGKTLLEVGCGIGNMTNYFYGACKNYIGLDISESFISHMGIDYPGADLHHCDIMDEKVLSLKSKHIDTISCINVLEHIEDDKKALEHMFQILEPNGCLLLFLPAVSWLYGSLDKDLEHFRRYDKKNVVSLLGSTGFTIDKIFFSNFIGLFGWFVNGKILKRRKFPILQPLLFDKILSFTTAIEKRITLPVGMTLMAIARKPAVQPKK
jgi:SAM-dependent methyltransferase